MRLAPQEIRTFFITSVAHERRAVLQTDRMAQLFLDVLEDNRSQSRFLLHEFVIMPNHFHLLITPAHEIPLEKAVQFIKGGFSYRAKKELGYRFEVWEPGFTQHRIKDAQDMTVDYVDKEARLRSLRAQEAQYLAIMRRASTVKDTLEVSGKLGEVRGEIERQQAEFAALARQVETVAIAIALRAEADAQVFGLHWRPMYELKLAARDGLESLANYAVTMTAALFELPAVLLWLATALLTLAIGWHGVRWGWRKLALPQAR